MNIRPIQPSDGENVIELWNSCLAKDKITSYDFDKKIICDINFNPNLFLLAVENGKPIGFAYGTIRIHPDEAAGLQAEKGWIVSMGVEESSRRKGIGKELLSRLEKALNVQKIELGAYPTNYFFPGVDKDAYAGGCEFFKAMNYTEKGTSSSMDLNLNDYINPSRYVNKKAELINKNYVFSTLKPCDSMSTLEFLQKEFPYWLPIIRHNIAERLQDETIQIVKNPQGDVVGFALHAMDGNIKRFGPFGVSPDLQGTGIGGVLFHNLINKMVEKKIDYTYFLWTGGRNIDIYSTWGMKVFRTFLMMERNIV